VVLRALDTADPDHATLHEAPYVGVQFAVIPSFRTIGDEVGRYVSEAVAGRLSVDQALARSQHAAERDMMLAGRRR
jgi:sorbitol/mannitol transport system substrate-binding protein